MTFKIGDDIIMTADSGKGNLFDGYVNGEYSTQVIDIGELIITVKDDKGFIPRKNFRLDGSCSTHPGMSIRLAEDKKEFRRNEHPAHFSGNCPDCTKQPTPSQWIEGQIPRDYRGYVWICGGIYDKAICGIYKGDTREEGYTHWMPAELPPPPPPAKEVEAFGYLEWDKMYDDEKNVNNHIDYSKVCRNDARRFYSQPATAENLNKYLKCEHKSMRFDFTIDQFINWHNGQHDDKLLFTPAALDILGVK